MRMKCETETSPRFTIFVLLALLHHKRCCSCWCVWCVWVCVMREKEATAGPATHHNPQPLLFIIKMKRPDVSSSSSAVSAVKKKAYHRDNSHQRPGVAFVFVKPVSLLILRLTFSLLIVGDFKSGQSTTNYGHSILVSFQSLLS